MTDGQFGGVDPGMDVPPALLGERPVEGALARVREERAQRLAQFAPAAVRGQRDRPVRGGTRWERQPGAQPRRAVRCQLAEAGLVAGTVAAGRCRGA